MDNATNAAWTGYIRGFAEYLGETIYETIEMARDAASPGERIYQITHVETVQPRSSAPTAPEPESTILCPACGAAVESYERRPFYVKHGTMEPMWEGGPLVEVPGLVPKYTHVPGVEREWTLNPCGDQFYALEFKMNESGRVVAIREAIGMSTSNPLDPAAMRDQPSPAEGDN